MTSSQARNRGDCNEVVSEGQYSNHIFEVVLIDYEKKIHSKFCDKFHKEKHLSVVFRVFIPLRLRNSTNFLGFILRTYES